jgi:hypothetical protein
MTTLLVLTGVKVSEIRDMSPLYRRAADLRSPQMTMPARALSPEPALRNRDRTLWGGEM